MCYSAQIERDWHRILGSCFVALALAGCSSNILLTPEPIDIGPEEKIVPSETKLSVENERAALYVHFADLPHDEIGKIMMDKMNFPIAELVHPSVCRTDGACFELHYAGISLGDTDVEGIYRADWIHLDSHKYTSVRIRADKVIKNVSLIWKAMKK
jgi:hypothetical protein